MLNEIRLGAKWWADLLRNSEHPHSDVGDRSLNTALIFIQQPPRFAPEQIDSFEAALIDVLTRVYINGEKYGRNKDRYSPGRGFGTDYHPGEILEEAASAAGIDLYDCLPAKTIMWLNDGAVRVKRGYGAPVVAVTTEPGGTET